MRSDYYNYVYLDPEKPGNYKYILNSSIIEFDFEPFYVGKGTGKRYKQHKYLSGNSGRFMKSKMKSLRSKQLIPKIVLLNINSPEFKVLEFETNLIKTIGRRDLGLGPLTNHKDSDSGNINQIYSKEYRQKLRDINLGKKLSEEHKKKIGLANKGRISSITTKAQKEWRNNNKHKYNKKVLLLDLQDTIIKEFECLGDACKFINLYRTYIGDRCRTKDMKIVKDKYKFIYK